MPLEKIAICNMRTTPVVEHDGMKMDKNHVMAEIYLSRMAQQ